jgi:hypothetical protein
MGQIVDACKYYVLVFLFQCWVIRRTKNEAILGMQASMRSEVLSHYLAGLKNWYHFVLLNGWL